MNYSVTLKVDSDGIREFYVHKGTVPVYMATSVWVSSDGVPRCTSCSGPLKAMLASCSHAKAVKRFLARKANQGEAERLKGK